MTNHLIVYYSWSGNTKKIAEEIQRLTGGDVFQIQPVKPYPKEYNQCTVQAKQEINAGYKPALKESVDNLAGYKTVFVGSPNWWSTIAPPVLTFLTEYDLTGKQVVPFCTHGGGGTARCFSDTAKLAVKSEILDGLSVSGSRAGTSKSEVENWIKKIGL
ncbi:MAG: hypothetical protein LBT89_06860 [Planctomycetaceae bacterium]|jgi:flavodoxin|nr:hypothetical protein [Planctomycetaceae bacterium]